jgi:hypothetical protein
MAKHVHMSLIVTYKLYHHCIRGHINNVVMSIFIDTPRSHGPSRERGRGSHINTSWYYTKIYLVKDQVAPEHIWGPRTHLGSYPPRYKTKDQPMH